MQTSILTKSFKDFENIPELSFKGRAQAHAEYLKQLDNLGYMNYRLPIISPCGPVVQIETVNGKKNQWYVNFSSNDYLGYTQHSAIKNAIVDAVQEFGAGSGASPLIGGFFSYHEKLEDNISGFFKRPKGSAIVYTTGYTANSACILSVLKKEDLAIVDMAVHSSIYEGLSGTNTKRFLHNDISNLERILINTQGKYRTLMVIIDGVYSQDGDIADLKEITSLAKKYGAVIMMDDAHGVGVFGETGRGIIELDNLYNNIDIIMGTLSKAIGNIGGFIVSEPLTIKYLQFQSRQYAFSTYAAPSIVGATKALELIDTEPLTRKKLWDNINYYKNGLKSLGLNVGTTCSAIIPVKIGNPQKACEVGKKLLELGIFGNSIMYPAVAMNDARIRMSIMATHEKEHLDEALNAFEDLINKKIIDKVEKEHTNTGQGANETEIS